eukprot:1160561-Pelagomonas_calceolata.AAC.5
MALCRRHSDYLAIELKLEVSTLYSLPPPQPHHKLSPNNYCTNSACVFHFISHPDLWLFTAAAWSQMRCLQGRNMKYAGAVLRLTSSEVEEGLAAHRSCPDEIIRFIRMET